MSDIHAGTMLAYAAGAAVFVCVVMAVYWSVQRVPPGFGRWTVSAGLIGLACLALADRGHLPRPVVTLVVPGLILTAAVLRAQGVIQFFSHKRANSWWLLTPLVPLAIISLLAYVWDDSAAPTAVTAIGVALTAWFMAVVSIRHSRRPTPWFHVLVSTMFVAYGGLWFGSGIHWLVSGSGFPVDTLDAQSIMFFAIITAYELFWLIALIVISAKRRADDLEVARDDSERMRRQLADIVAFLPDATFVLDKDLRVLAWNRVIAEKTGLPASEVLGSRWDSGVARELLGGGFTLSEVLLDPGKTIPSRYRNQRGGRDRISADQEWCHPTDPSKRGYLWHTARLLRDVDGEVTGTIETIRDVTAAVEAENAVRESEERYRSLFEHSLDGVLVIAPGGAVVDANPAACRMLGRTRDEICEADPGSLVLPRGQAEGDSGQLDALGTGVRELDFVRGDGSTFSAECMSVVWTDSMSRLRAFVQFRDTTDRAEAQAVLRDTRDSLLESHLGPPMGSWEIDVVARSVRLSRGAMQVFGIDHQSPYFPLDGRVLSSTAQDPVALEAEITRVMTKGGSVDLEYSIKRRSDRVPRKVRSIISAVCDGRGTPVRVVGVTRDITDASCPSELQLGSYVLDHSDDQVFWVDGAGNITNVNEAACEQLGYSREELTAMSIYDLNPELPAGSAETVEKVKSVGGRRHETVHRTKDGRDIPVEVTVNVAALEGGDQKFVVAHDISDRRELELRLKRAQMSLERGGGALVWADAEGRPTFATDEICERLRLPRELLLTRKVTEVGLALAGDWPRIWTEVMQHGSFAHRATLRDKEGDEEEADVVFHRMEYQGRDYALIVVRDLSPAETDLSSAPTDDLATLQSQKLEAVGQLAGGIAHDFNNLLAAIMGYGDLILTGDEGRSPAALRRDAREIRNAAERAAALTSQILAFARRQPLRPRRLDLSELVASMEGRIRAMIADGVHLTVSVPDVDCMVEVDAEHFERALATLVTNAQEAMPEGGRLRVGVENVVLSEESCRTYPEMRAGSYVTTTVSDTGIGMDEQTRQRIFEPFFTTEGPGEGAGLGLAAVYGFVRQSGGNIAAYSEVGKGTSMKMYLPEAVAGEGATVQVAASAGPVAEGGETVLVVDDEAPLRRLVARVLGESGYRVLVAGSGVEALELLEDMEERPDLLVTDVVLPGEMQGNDLAALFSSEVPGLPVLYMSGHPRDAIVHSGRLDEGVFFLGKPFTPERLCTSVREVLGRHRTKTEDAGSTVED